MEEEVPSDWNESYLSKIPKKGALSRSSDYRGISLLSVPGKVFNRVFPGKIRDAVDPQLKEQQAGFQKKQSLELNSSLYVNFVDYEKSFNSVDRETLWTLL